jgi:hypothetical protein
MASWPSPAKPQRSSVYFRGWTWVPACAGMSGWDGLAIRPAAP